MGRRETLRKVRGLGVNGDGEGTSVVVRQGTPKEGDRYRLLNQRVVDETRRKVRTCFREKEGSLVDDPVNPLSPPHCLGCSILC